MIRIQINCAFEFPKAAVHITKEMANLETDRGMDWIDLVSFLRAGGQQGRANRCAQEQEKWRFFHRERDVNKQTTGDQRYSLGKLLHGLEKGGPSPRQPTKECPKGNRGTFLQESGIMHSGEASKLGFEMAYRPVIGIVAVEKMKGAR